MALTAYIRYDHNNRIVPGGPIVTKNKPAVGNWQVVAEGTNVTLVGQLRAFVKLNRYNKPLAGSLFLGKYKPATGKWLEVNATYTPQAPCVPFINTIIISNGSFSSTNGTYTRPDIATAFSQVGGTGAIFFGGDAWYLNAGVAGNVARNTSELGTGTWEPWAPGSSSGITAQYIYSSCGTTTTTTTGIPTTTTTTTLNLVYGLLDVSYDLPSACANIGGNINGGIPVGETLETTSVIYANFNGYLPPNNTYYFRGVNSTGVYTRTFLTNSNNTIATSTSGVNYC